MYVLGDEFTMSKVKGRLTGPSHSVTVIKAGPGAVRNWLGTTARISED
jgi:hypothetical protein